MRCSSTENFGSSAARKSENGPFVGVVAAAGFVRFGEQPTNSTTKPTNKNVATKLKTNFANARVEKSSMIHSPNASICPHPLGALRASVVHSAYGLALRS